jgi:hypothetical protein
MPRPKGTPKTGGRRKGTPNKTTVQARTTAAEIVDDPVCLRNLLVRARAGTLAPPLELMLWHRAKGKPPDGQESTSSVDVDASTLDTSELKTRLADALDGLSNHDPKG